MICVPAPPTARLNSFHFFGGTMFSNRILRMAIVLVLAASTAMAQTAAGKQPAKSAGGTATHAKGAPTVAEAQAFMKKAEEQLEDLAVRASRASWVQENFITDDTEALSAQANEKLTAVVTQLALDARRFDHMKLPPDLAR